MPAPFLDPGLHYRFLTLFFDFYADDPFIPQCPEIPESERIDCVAGQVVTEVRKWAPCHWPAGFLFKISERVTWRDDSGREDYGPLIWVEFFLSCLIELNYNTKEVREGGKGKRKKRRN